MIQTGDTAFILQREMNPNDNSIMGVFSTAENAMRAIPGIVETVRMWEVDHDVTMWYIRSQGTTKYYLLTRIPVSS